MDVYKFKGKRITREAILRAMRDYDQQYRHPNDYNKWLEKKNYKFAIQEKGRIYPPKHILSQVSGISVLDFNGGEQTNSVFRSLGFLIMNKPLRWR